MVAVNRVGPSGSSFSPDLVKEFEGVLRDIQQKFNAAGVNGGIESQAQAFIATADKNSDQRVNAAELAAAMNLNPQRAEQFINAFNSKGDKDGALNASELAKAVGAVKEPSEPLSNGQNPLESGESGGGQGGGRAAGRKRREEAGVEALHRAPAARRGPGVAARAVEPISSPC